MGTRKNPLSMGTDTKLVVIIATKNRKFLLSRALASVHSQSYQNYRIVVVNDGSTDDTHEYLNSLRNSGIKIIHNDKSYGVNAARNAALKTIKPEEWAIPLDDDDMFLPDALTLIASNIKSAPPQIQVLCFNTITRTDQGDKNTGRQFESGEMWHDPTYKEFFLDPKSTGDNRAAYKWTLFPKYLFREDINGFEGEWSLLVARDNVGVRIRPERIILIDQVHKGEHLSHIAANAILIHLFWHIKGFSKLTGNFLICIQKSVRLDRSTL